MFTKFNQSIDARRDALKDGEKGFTLIELLVVVIIIGILAAIAIPVFLNQRQSAWRASVESDLKNAAIIAETFATKNGGSYVGLDLEDAENNFKASDDVTVSVETATVTGFTLEGTHSQLTGESLSYDSEDGGLGEWTSTP